MIPSTLRKLAFGLVLTLAPSALAATLAQIPGPDATGGMIMPYVTLHYGAYDEMTGNSTGSISVDLRESAPFNHIIPMFPLQQFQVSNGTGEPTYPFADSIFDTNLANRQWYDLLDPNHQHLPFSTQVGFMMEGTDTSLLIGTGHTLYIEALSISAGLTGYDIGFWEDVWFEGNPEANPNPPDWLVQFHHDPTQSTGHAVHPYLANKVAWGGAASGGRISMWHPVFIAEGPGLYSATFRLYLGDGQGAPLDGWESTEFTLHWRAIPEPSTYILLMGGGVLFLGLWRRKRSWQP